MIPVTCFCLMRRKLQLQSEMLRNLQQQQQGALGRNYMEPVHAMVELTPMHIGVADVESVPAATVIALGAINATTPSIGVAVEDQLAEKEQLLSDHR